MHPERWAMVDGMKFWRTGNYRTGTLSEQKILACNKLRMRITVRNTDRVGLVGIPLTGASLGVSCRIVRTVIFLIIFTPSPYSTSTLTESLHYSSVVSIPLYWRNSRIRSIVFQLPSHACWLYHTQFILTCFELLIQDRPLLGGFVAMESAGEYISSRQEIHKNIMSLLYAYYIQLDRQTPWHNNRDNIS